MKYNILFSLVLMFSDCQSPNNQYNPGYQVVNSPNGGQVVVIKNDDGSDFFMDYLIFQSLMNSGGIGGVRNYYGQHRYEPDYMNQQNQYKSVVHNHYYNSSSNSQPTNTQKSQQPEVKYKPSSGFSNAPSTSTQNNNSSSNVSNGLNNSTQSKGFSQKYFKPDVPTKTQPPVYKPSSGFSTSGSTSTKSNSNPYNQSKGFGKKN